MTKTYETKPVRKQAFQITEKIYNEIMSLKDGEEFQGLPSFRSWPKWLQDVSGLDPQEPGCFSAQYVKSYEDGELEVFINTLEGKHIVSPNDWIIQGLKGELYPCKPDIFEKTYKEVKEENAAPKNCR